MIPEAVGAEELFGSVGTDAAERLRLLAEILNPHTTGILGKLGVRPEWKCLDLGSGNGSVANWLAGTGASVIATDPHPEHIQVPDTVEVRVHDANSDWPPGTFDLIHARLLLMQLPDSSKVLKMLAGALKPGGVLVVSDFDRPPRDWVISAPDRELHSAVDRYSTALVEVCARSGIDFDWSRRTPAAFLAAGLSEVRSVMTGTAWGNGDPGIRLLAHYTCFESGLEACGLPPSALAAVQRALNDSGLRLWSPHLYTTTGIRRQV
ncbi:class I SAM-dependent methyltransferase [Nocardia sp. NBC_00511]|uniref:class I SAM-dependent methyltransferase n=1 Tax=Nocardia sp. NBC_00511 TaxID=2903591 RepID=UPI0030E123E5